MPMAAAVIPGILASQTKAAAATVAQPGSFLKTAIKSGLPMSAKVKQQQPMMTTKSPATSQSPTASIVRAAVKELLLKPAFGVCPAGRQGTVNAILRLFGGWLFQACQTVKDQQKDSVEVRAARAVAIIALTKAFCCKLSEEHLVAEQVKRYFRIVKTTTDEADPMIVSSMLVYSADLFRVNLPTSEKIWPSLLTAMERLLSDPIRRQLLVRESCLQQSCLHILSATVVYPFYFEQAGQEGSSPKAVVHLAACQWNTLKMMLNDDADLFNLPMCVQLMAVHCVAYVQWSSSRRPDDRSDCTALVTTTVVSLGEVLVKNKFSGFAICLAIYDALSALVAIMPVGDGADTSAYMQLLSVVCRAIEDQLALPARSHSRDMHSAVVAAFNFLEVLLVHVPNLLKNNSCLESVCSIVVLGLYGCDVQNYQNLDKVNKKPASQRVHDAADQLLHFMFSRVGDSFHTVAALQNEAYLIQWMTNNHYQVDGRFLYVLFNSSILAVTDVRQTTDSDQSGHDAAVIFRTPFTNCICQLCVLLNDTNVGYGKSTVRPQPMVANKELKCTPASFFPPDVDAWPKCQTDFSIPELKMDDRKARMLTMLKAFEQHYQQEAAGRPALGAVDVQPECHGTGTHRSRLLLFDLGVTQLSDSRVQDFRLLNSDSADFQNALTSLDRMPCRHIATVHVFYVAKGQNRADDILAHGDWLQNTDASFLTFLRSLGKLVSVQDQDIWTGRWSTAYGRQPADVDIAVGQTVDSHYVLDGRRHLIYWSSPSVELAFVVPTNDTSADSGSYSSTSSLSTMDQPPARPPRNHRCSATSESGDSIGKQPSAKTKRVPPYQDYRFLIVWLQCFEDWANVPVDDLLDHCLTGQRGGTTPDLLYLIYICPLDNGLYRLKFVCPSTKLGLVGPICDGLVLSLQLLPPLIRQSVVNAGTRRRLEQEGYISPCQRRRQKIAEIGNRFCSQGETSDQLFRLLSF